MNKNPIICAIDEQDVKKAANLCNEIKDFVGHIKLGLEFFIKNGPDGVEKISNIGLPIFLDLKLHDIPNTVAQGIKSAVSLNVDIITIHTMGGYKMMKAAADAALEESVRLNSKKPLVIGVTVLTSMEQNDLVQIGIGNGVDKQVLKLASLAKQAGLDGIVCSPHEIKTIKNELGLTFKTIVPGIRPTSSEKYDQARVMTPKQAIDNGADYLVIGRPITMAENPAKSAEDIFVDINNS